MCKDEDGDATDWIERAQQKHCACRTEAEYRSVLRDHHESLQSTVKRITETV